MSVYPAVGEAIKRARLARGWTQGELGKRLGVSHAAVSDIERGKTKADLDDLLRLAVVLGVRVDALLAPLFADSLYRQIATWARQFNDEVAR